jgi:hypothetical protein
MRDTLISFQDLPCPASFTCTMCTIARTLSISINPIWRALVGICGRSIRSQQNQPNEPGMNAESQLQRPRFASRDEMAGERHVARTASRL